MKIAVLRKNRILKYIMQLTSFDIAESIKLAAGLACVVYSISPAYPQTYKFITKH